MDVGEVRGGIVVRERAALLAVELHQLFAGGRCRRFLGQHVAVSQQRVDVGTGIGHFAEFHGKRSIPFRETFSL